jgi:hypothetical protein
MLTTYFHHVGMYELSLLIIALPLTLSASVNVVLDNNMFKQVTKIYLAGFLICFATFPLWPVAKFG